MNQVPHSHLNSLNNKKNSVYELHNVSFKYDNKTENVIKSVDLNISFGEVLFITGKSGAGKSTLLNLLSGILEPTSGAIKCPENNSNFVAKVFQDLKLFEQRSVEQNLWYAFDRKAYKSKNEFQRDLTELSRVLGVTDKLKVKVRDLNGGMKQKVAILRALLTKPKVLVADEPTAALDKESSAKIFDLLNFYNMKRGLTVIWASHNRDLIKSFSGRTVHLDNGKLIYSGQACFI